MMPPHGLACSTLDPLSEALGSCCFQCKVFEHLKLNRPWGIAVPDGIVAFYAILSGCGRLRIERTQREVPFFEGDLVVAPQSFAHVLVDAPGSPVVAIEEVMRRTPSGGDGREATRLLACLLTLPRHCSYLVQMALPPIISMRRGDEERSPGLDETLKLMLGEAELRRPGWQGIIDRLAQVVNEKGELLAVHHKSRLTPADAQAYAFPESGPTAFMFRGIPMGVVICFEGYRFPENVRMLAKDGAKIVFHPQCNHFFKGMAWKLPVHEALLTARAAENTLWLVSSNMSHPLNNCRSLVIGPNGLIRDAAILGQEMLVWTDADPDLATHAFLKDNLDDMARALGEK